MGLTSSPPVPAVNLVPTSPADATKFLNGANPPAFAVPAGGGGATIPSVTNIIIGDGAGNGADSGKAVADFATAAQGAKADSAVQPGGAGTVAADTGWNGNADEGDKTVSIPSGGTLNSVGNALELVVPGAGTALVAIGQKLKALEAALVIAKIPNA